MAIRKQAGRHNLINLKAGFRDTPENKYRDLMKMPVQCCKKKDSFNG